MALSNDKRFEIEQDAAQEEYIDKLREEFREELIDEILEERGEEWTAWVRVEAFDVQGQIGAVAKSLKGLLSIIERDNKLPDQPGVLTELERRQLIAVLEAALHELKSPYVDRGRFKGIAKGLGKVLIKAVEKEASGAVQAGLRSAVQALVEFLKRAADIEDETDFWS